MLRLSGMRQAKSGDQLNSRYTCEVCSYLASISTIFSYTYYQLTRKARPLRVVNILSQQEDQLLVACEDTMADIQVGPAQL